MSESEKSPKCPHLLARQILDAEPNPVAKPSAAALSEAIQHTMFRAIGSAKAVMNSRDVSNDLRTRFIIEFITYLMRDSALVRLNGQEICEVLRSDSPLFGLNDLIAEQISKRAKVLLGRFRNAQGMGALTFLAERVHEEQDRTRDDLEAHLISEIRSSVNAVGCFVELVREVYFKQFGERIDEETYKKTIRSPQFIASILAIGHGGVQVEHAYYEVIRDVDSRSTRNADYFELLDFNGTLVLRMKPEIAEKVKARRAADTGVRPRKKCPAAWVTIPKKGDNPKRSAMKDFTVKLVEIYAEYYVPHSKKFSFDTELGHRVPLGFEQNALGMFAQAIMASMMRVD